MSQDNQHDKVPETEEEGMSFVADARILVEKLKKYRDLSKIKLLDAGGGTGVVTKEFADAGTGELYLFDVTKSNVELAKKKLKTHVDSGRIKEIKEHGLPNIPYPDGFFDVVVMCQVLHHLDIWNDSENKESEGSAENYGKQLSVNTEKDPLDLSKEWPNCKASMKEAARVLKKGGILLINEMTAGQTVKGQWYYALAPVAHNSFAACFPPLKLFEQYLKEFSFKVDEISDANAGWATIDPMTGNIEAEDNPIMFMISEEEMKKMKEDCKRMREDGSIVQFAKENQHPTGGATIIISTKGEN